jgi:hypothetical protein
MGGSTPQVPEAPTPTPPVTANNAASMAVEQSTYRQQLRRKGIGQTTYAGANMPSMQGMQGYAGGMSGSTISNPMTGGAAGMPRK